MPLPLALLAAAALAAPSQRATNQVLVTYGAVPKDPGYAALQKVLKKNLFLDGPAIRIDRMFRFPKGKQLVLAFGELGVANAFYNPKDRRVTIAWELFSDLMAAYKKEGGSDAARVQKSLNAVNFILYHEIGHALIDILDLPVTGREEDAVDQFSYWMLRNLSDVQKNDSGSYSAIDAAKWFALTASADGIQESAFWDSHSLNQQRFYDILTLVHGSDPKKFDFLVGTNMLPAERARGSRAEWLKMRDSWDRLLIPHLNIPKKK